jgi:hypothetical protein
VRNERAVAIQYRTIKRRTALSNHSVALPTHLEGYRGILEQLAL